MNTYHKYKTGKPIGEVDFPALTICSQGWVPDVVNRVLEKQFDDYLKSQNVSRKALNKAQLQTHRSAYAQAMYPGSKLPPEKIISQLISQNPEVTLSSEVLVDKGYDECENLAGETSQDLSCPNSPGVQWDKFEMDRDGSKIVLCLNEDVNFGQMTTGGSSFLQAECDADPYLPQCCKNCGPELVGNTCTRYGADRLRFSLEDSALQEKLFELYCEWFNRYDPNNLENKCKYQIEQKK